MSKKILVVDDEPDVLNLAKMILERSGFLIVTASDGLEGEKAAVTEQPDLILLDVVMPGKTGLEVCRALKSQVSTRHIPMILFSVSVSKSLRDLAREAGADGVIMKPFTIQGLTATIKNALSANESAPASSQERT